MCRRTYPRLVALAILLSTLAAHGIRAQEDRWPAPELNDDNCQRWSTFIWPTEQELKWRKVRWHTELEDAAAEARKLQRPILLWAMNGHPCGET